MIELARTTGARVHIVHVSSAQSLALIRDARGDGVRITAETCPHYLHFTAEQIAEGATEYKCAPPIREAANRDGLWRGLTDGSLDLIASDHSPCVPSLKCTDTGSFDDAWGGIASLQLGLPVVWSGARQRGIGVQRVAEWMAAAPARLAGLQRRKGTIAAGCDADFVVFDPETHWTVDAASLQHRNPVTPYHGAELRGSVRQTYLRGELIYEQPDTFAAPCGKPLLRDAITARAT
jgi:allantoinase